MLPVNQKTIYLVHLLKINPNDGEPQQFQVFTFSKFVLYIVVFPSWRSFFFLLSLPAYLGQMIVIITLIRRNLRLWFSFSILATTWSWIGISVGRDADRIWRHHRLHLRIRGHLLWDRQRDEFVQSNLHAGWILSTAWNLASVSTK